MNYKIKIHMKNRSLPFGVYQELLQINMKRIKNQQKIKQRI